jgi:predicted lipoprotein
VTAATARAVRRPALSPRVRRLIGAGVVLLLLLVVVLGTRVVADGDPIAQGAEEFDPATFGAEQFPAVQEAVVERAVDAATLATAIAADRDAAIAEYAVESSGGPVFSTTFTGTAGDAASGIVDVAVPGVDGVALRVQLGPAINGTELRDATGEVSFGQFTNQIEFQNAAAALNDELKTQVLADVDPASLSGREITVTGAFTLINPESWLVTPVEIEVP